MAFITYESKVGTPVQAGSVKLTPVSQVFQVNAPVANGGLIWNRPVAVQVENEQGEMQILPIQDVTRQALMLFAGICLVFGILTNIVQRTKRSK